MNITMLAGSNRQESSSTKLAHYVGRLLEENGCRVTMIDLYRRPVPMYCPDAAASDENVLDMKKACQEADAIVLATAEYHGSITGVLKNALDYMGSEQFDSKAVLSVSSSGGAVAVSSLQQLQVIVRNLHGVNSPEWISIGGENRVFDKEGEPANPKIKERALKAVAYFMELAHMLKKEK